MRLLYLAFTSLILNNLVLAQDWGTLQGRVQYDGGIPEKTKLNIDKDKEDCLATGPLYSDEWEIDPKSKGIRWAYVWLTAAQGGSPITIHPSLKDVPKEDVIIDQPCCMFEPHAVAIRQGQTIVVKNSAKIVHNVNWSSIDNSSGNQSIAAGSQIEIKNLVASHRPIGIACNIHPWMKGWVRVFDHPYFAITDKDGKFEFKNAPAGKFNLVVWHEGVGWGPGGKAGQPITISAGKVTDLDKILLKKSD